MCKSHYLELIEGGYGSSTDGDACEAGENQRNKNRKSKRNRTTFTDEQIHILQANFQLDCNPDGQDLERIADISGLSKRVVQVVQNISKQKLDCGVVRFGSRTRAHATRNTSGRRAATPARSRATPPSTSTSPSLPSTQTTEVNMQ